MHQTSASSLTKTTVENAPSYVFFKYGGDAENCPRGHIGNGTRPGARRTAWPVQARRLSAGWPPCYHHRSGPRCSSKPPDAQVNRLVHLRAGAFTWLVNSSHVSVLKLRTGPGRSLVSRMSTQSRTATSTQLACDPE